ncbi:hypothetical protein BH11CYA1_BH11CYA1_17680 [soil metagenome]
MAIDVRQLPKDGGDDKTSPEAAAVSKAVQEITNKDKLAQKSAQDTSSPTKSDAAVLPVVTLENLATPAAKPDKPIDRVALEKDAVALREATGNDNWVARWADRDKIVDLLKGHTAAELKVLNGIYKMKYGKGIEQEMSSFMTGSDLARLQAALHKKDNNEATVAADRVDVALKERGEWTGRSGSIIEKDLRDTLRTANSEQIKQISAEYQERHGKPLAQAISQDQNLNETTKQALLVYLKGNDKRTPEDFAKLTIAAVKSEDLQFFKEVMKDATAAERQSFLASGGERQMRDAWSGSDLVEARDFSADGKLSAATQVKENTGVLWDSNKGIELALSRMTDGERSDYRIGRQLSGDTSPLSTQDSDRLKAMSPAEKSAATGQYNTLRHSLEAAGNATELARWESMINVRGGTLAATLDRHRGTLWNDSTADIGTTIENMSKKDWEAAKANPAARKELEQMLDSLNQSGQAKQDLLKIFDLKMSAKTYEETADTGKVSVTERMDEKWHFYRNDQGAMLEAVSGMSKEDRERYKTDSKFKAELDQKVDSYMSGQAQEQAQKILKAVELGEKPVSTIVTKLAQHAADFNTDEGKAVRDIRDAFNADPTLRSRINEPKTDADRAFAADFKRAGEDALGKGMYDEYVGELLKTGSISADKMSKLSKGVFSDDEETTYEDIAKAPKEQRDRLVSDLGYQNTTLEHLNSDERKVALAAAAQGEYRSEDKIRALVLGFGGGKDIVEQLKQVPTEQLTQLKSDYARKYGTSFESDLMAKLSGQEMAEARRVLVADKSTAERLDVARDESYKTRSGIGAGFADMVSASGTQSDDALDQMLQGAAEANRKGEKASPEQMKNLFEDFATAIDNHRETKSAAADYTSDALIAGAAIASVIASGGTDLPLVAALLAAGGAATKVGTKAVLMGSDYDFKLGTVAKDATIGALTGATSVLGQAQLAAVFKVGQQAAKTAATATLSTLAKESVEVVAQRASIELAEGVAGKQLFVAGYEKILSEGTETTMRNLLANGARKIEEKSFAAIAEKVVDAGIQGPLREAAVASVQRELAEQATKEFAKHTANWLVYQASSQGLNAGAGAVANSGTGFIEGVAAWDSRKGLSDNLSSIGLHTFNSSLAGAGGALVFGGVIKAAEAGLSGLSRLRTSPQISSSSELRLGSDPLLGPDVTPTSLIRHLTDVHGPNISHEVPRGQIDFAPNAAMAAIETHARPSSAAKDQIWQPVRELEKLAPVERAALIREIGKDITPLNTSLRAGQFVDSIEGATKSWSEDFSHLPKALDDSYLRFQVSGQKANTLVEKYGMPWRNGELDTADMAARMKGHPEDLATLKAYVADRQVYSDALITQTKVLDQRVSDLQKAMDAFTAANELPRVEVRSGRSAAMVGKAATYSDGVITLNPENLLSKDRSLDLFESAYHELTHHEQRFTVGRSLADELHIGAQPSKEEIGHFRSYYEFKTKQRMSEAQAQQVLDARGKLSQLELSPEQTFRANNIEDAFRKNAPAGEKLVALGNDFRAVKSYLKPLQIGEDPNAAYHLLTKVFEGKDELLSKRLFGTATPPAEAQAFYGKLKNYLDGHGDTWNKTESANATRYLKDILEKRLGDINTSRQAVYADYMQTHEVDAFLSGQRARSQAMERGHKPAPEIQAARRTASDNAEIEYILDNAFESIGRHVGPEVPKVKPPRLFFDGGQGTVSNYDLASDSITFDHASVTVKSPAAKLQHQFNRSNFRDGEELSIRGLTEGLPGLSKVKVVTANSERVSLRYEGPYTISRQSLPKVNNEIGQLDDFIAEKIVPKLTEPNFNAAGSAEAHVKAALLMGDNLATADASVLNYALKNSSADGEFRPILFKELARRAQGETLPERTAYLWFNEIGQSLKSNPAERAKAYKDFLDYTPPQLRDQITKSGEASELLTRAFNAVGDGNSWPLKGSVEANWATGEVAPVVRQLEKVRNHVISSAEFRSPTTGGEKTQLTVWNMLSGDSGILAGLKRDRRISADWQVYPTEAGSPLDRAGSDYLLVNTKTGEFHFLDATSNPEKSNVFALRRPGVITTENSLFDISGALKVDDPSSSVRAKAISFRPDLEDQILRMTQQPSPFRLGADGPPLPSLTRVSEQEATTQLGQLIDWAKAKARNSADSYERTDWQDMASVVERAKTYSNIQASQRPSPELATNLDSVTKTELINFAMAKVLKHEYPMPAKVTGGADVQISKDRTVMLKTKDGGFYNGGNIENSVEEARLKLLDPKALPKFLSNAQIEALGGDGKALKGLPAAEREAAIERQLRANPRLQANVKLVASVFMNDQNVIRNGGAAGDKPATIFENVKSKLRARTEDSLLGKPPVVAAKPGPLNANAGRIESLETSLPEATKVLKEWREPPSRLDVPAQNISDILDLIIEESNSIPVAELAKLKGLRDAYSDPKNPEHARAMKMINDLMSAN